MIEVINKIGYGFLKQGSDIDFRTAFDNRGDDMPFGLIDSCLWILSPTQVYKFYDPEVSPLEKN